VVAEKKEEFGFETFKAGLSCTTRVHVRESSYFMYLYYVREKNAVDLYLRKKS